MGLTPKQPLEPTNLTWEDLDKRLKLFITSPGDTTIINTEHYLYSKQEIIEELEKNNYQVKDHGGDFIFAIG